MYIYYVGVHVLGLYSNFITIRVVVQRPCFWPDFVVNLCECRRGGGKRESGGEGEEGVSYCAKAVMAFEFCQELWGILWGFIAIAQAVPILTSKHQRVLILALEVYSDPV